MLWCTKTICLDRLPRICCCWNIEYIIYYNKSYFFVGKVNIYNVNIYVSSYMNYFSKHFGIVAACYFFFIIQKWIRAFYLPFLTSYCIHFLTNYDIGNRGVRVEPWSIFKKVYFCPRWKKSHEGHRGQTLKQFSLWLL